MGVGYSGLGLAAHKEPAPAVGMRAVVEGKEPALDREAAGDDNHLAAGSSEAVRPAVLAAAGSASRNIRCGSHEGR